MNVVFFLFLFSTIKTKKRKNNAKFKNCPLGRFFVFQKKKEKKMINWNVTKWKIAIHLLVCLFVSVLHDTDLIKIKVYTLYSTVFNDYYLATFLYVLPLNGIYLLFSSKYLFFCNLVVLFICHWTACLVDISHIFYFLNLFIVVWKSVYKWFQLSRSWVSWS